MPLQLTTRQEAFCQAVLVEPTTSAAYRKAYPGSRKWKAKSVHENACKLLSNAKVKPRLAELRAMNTERSAVTVEGLTEELRLILADAKEDRQHSGAVSAVNLIAKMHGMLVDRLKVEPVSIEIKRSYD